MTNEEKVTCNWEDVSRETEERFPELARYHRDHGNNLSKCDAWVCACWKDVFRGGESGQRYLNGFVCSNCSREFDANGNRRMPQSKTSKPRVCRSCQVTIVTTAVGIKTHAASCKG